MKMKKRLLSILLSLALLLGLLPGMAFAAGPLDLDALNEGDRLGGSYVVTDSDYISIGSAEELKKIGIDDSYPLSGSYKLTADISGMDAMIGGAESTFSGTFDGGGHTITMNLSADNWNTGLFSKVDGTVKNLKTAGTVTSNSGNAAGIISDGSGTGTIENCWNTATVTGGAGVNVGGIVAHTANSTFIVRDCCNTGSVSHTSGDNSNGIVGYHHGQIINCFSANSGIARTRSNDKPGTVTSSYYVGAAGTGSTGTQLSDNAIETESSYSGWNFTATWVMTADGPRLRVFQPSKAMTVSAADVNVTVDGQPHGITVNVTDPASGATVKYGTTEGTYDQTTSPTQTEVGEKTVYYQVTADNYTTYTGSAKVTVSAKQTQTITAENVTANYGDTDKKVSATTNGNGAISYAVKEGSGDYIDVNVSTGALTIKKVGTATVIVTAAETSTYAQATKEVTVTINKANAVPATVTANDRTYDGTEKPLVTVTGTPTGGTMQYALGTATEATEQYTTSIPTATDAGTYYVWYRVVGDDNHLDFGPACVEATIKAAPSRVAITSVSKPADATYTGKAIKPAVTVKAGKKVLRAGTDYTVTYKGNVNAGTATVTVKGRGGYEGTRSVTFKVRPAAITSVSKPSDATYTGKAQKPSVTVKAGNKTLKAGTDYTVTYKGNVDAGTATVTAKGKGNYTGSKSATFRVKPAAITSVSKPADVTHTGKAIKPKVTVKAGSKVLKSGTDYTVSYKGNVEVGTATVTAKGRGNYAGTKSVTFRIKAAAEPQPQPEPQPAKAASVACVAYAKGLGWVSASGGSACGTTGQYRRVESLSLRLSDAPVAGGIEYRAHVQDEGWQKSWSRDGQRAGRAGSGKRVEAVQVRLTGQMAKEYDVYYRVHSQTYGWMAWAKNGESAGTAARLKRLEAVQVVVVKKGAKAPGKTYKGVTQSYGKAFVKA